MGHALSKGQFCNLIKSFKMFRPSSKALGALRARPSPDVGTSAVAQRGHCSLTKTARRTHHAPRLIGHCYMTSTASASPLLVTTVQLRQQGETGGSNKVS